MERKVIIGRQEIIIRALGQPVDSAFDRLHEAYFGRRPLPWPELEAAALGLFAARPADWAAHNDYFNNFTVIWQDLLNAGKYRDAECLWRTALDAALKWERSNPTLRIHKGTPYYFWSMTALLHDDVDGGYLLAHQALQEDIKTSQQPRPSMPAYWLVSLNYSEVHQAFQHWLQKQAQFLDSLLSNYKTQFGSSIMLKDVKRRFLDTPPTVDALFLLTYTLARLMRLTNAPNHLTVNPFAGQLELNILFDLALVIDNSIKPKNSPHQEFIRHAEYLLGVAGRPLTNAQLREINGQFKSDFDVTVQSALDARLTLPDGTALDRLQSDVALVYGLRNYGAHNTSTVPTVWSRFMEVQQSAFRTLFATIEYMYP